MFNKEEMLKIIQSDEFFFALYEFIYDLYQTVVKTDFDYRFLIVYAKQKGNSFVIQIAIDQQKNIKKIKKQNLVLFELDGLDLILKFANTIDIKSDLHNYAKDIVNTIVNTIQNLEFV